MQGQTAVVIGSTGLIGAQLVHLLLEDNMFSEIRMLVRRPVSLAHPKLKILMVSFDNYHDIKEKMSTGHVIFCCVGTTQRQVKGDKTAYRKVDYDIPVNTANAAIENGFKQYMLVSAVGADPQSGNFYLKLKGEAETAIRKLPFESIFFFRPSLLLGDRKEFRAGEKIGQLLMPLMSFVLRGSLSKYKPIQSIKVAKGMIRATKAAVKGVHVYEYKDINRLSEV